ncbi:MAG: hypothetical protein ACOYL6_07015 [Bacteriovoracaceae bacterium]
MKIAVIGASPAGIEIATHFTFMGAFVRVFEENEVGGSLHYEMQDLPMQGDWNDLSTAVGREAITFNQNLKTIPTVKEYLENYFLPLARHFSLSKNLMKAHVDRVHKRFLSKDETIPGHTRLTDLFRVVYSIAPIVVDDENREAYKNLEDNLGESVIESLKVSMEYYEDFDLVFDCSGRSRLNPMGPSQVYAIGEKRLINHSELIYGLEAFRSKTLTGSEVALIGSDTDAAMAFVGLKTWLETSGNFLTVITTENEAFSKLSKNLQQRALEIVSWSEAIYQKDKDGFMAKMEDWKNLDDFVRVKIPKPLEPKKKMTLLEACNITSVDKLIDQSKIFLSLENPEFRKKVLKEEITTLGFDQVLVMTGRNKDLSLFEGLNQAEPGFYSINGTNLVSAIKEIPRLEENVLTFFSRA